MRLPRSALVVLTLVWVLVMLYPDPGMLVRSARNVIQSRTDAEAARELASRLPDDPRLIEIYVLKEHVPYSYDWQAFGVPWYFPTAAEALRAGPGDCESRAMVLASILAAKGIPHELRMSFGHIWVDYPGKVVTLSENPALEIAGRRDGRFFLRWPEDLNLRREIAEQLAIHYEPAPPWRVFLLFGGLVLIPFWNAGARWAGGRRPAWGRGAEPAARIGRSPLSPAGRESRGRTARRAPKPRKVT